MEIYVIGTHLQNKIVILEKEFTTLFAIKLTKMVMKFQFFLFYYREIEKK